MKQLGLSLARFYLILAVRADERCVVSRTRFAEHPTSRLNGGIGANLHTPRRGTSQFILLEPVPIPELCIPDA
jgi:hypothetical protein